MNKAEQNNSFIHENAAYIQVRTCVQMNKYIINKNKGKFKHISDIA